MLSLTPAPALARNRVQIAIERAKRPIIPFRPFALTRSGHVHDFDFVLPNKIANQLRGFSGKDFGRIDEQVRSRLFYSKLNRLLRATD
jgi:hypothetical protein